MADFQGISLELLREARIVDLNAVGAACLLVYDMIITLDNEVNYVWKSKWGPSKILYFFTRYLALVVQIVDVFETTNFTLSTSFCQHWKYFSGITVQLLIIGVEIVLLLQVCSFYLDNTLLRYFLFSVLLAATGSQMAIMIMTLLRIISQPDPIQSPLLPGCLSRSVPQYFTEYWVPTLFVFVVLFILSVIRIFYVLRVGWRHASQTRTPFPIPLHTLFVTDGVIFIALLFGSLIANVLLLHLEQRSLSQVAVGWIISLLAISASRVHQKTLASSDKSNEGAIPLALSTIPHLPFNPFHHDLHAQNPCRDPYIHTTSIYSHDLDFHTANSHSRSHSLQNHTQNPNQNPNPNRRTSWKPLSPIEASHLTTVDSHATATTISFRNSLRAQNQDRHFDPGDRYVAFWRSKDDVERRGSGEGEGEAAGERQVEHDLQGHGRSVDALSWDDLADLDPEEFDDSDGRGVLTWTVSGRRPVYGKFVEGFGDSDRDIHVDAWTVGSQEVGGGGDRDHDALRVPSQSGEIVQIPDEHDFVHEVQEHDVRDDARYNEAQAEADIGDEDREEAEARAEDKVEEVSGSHGVGGAGFGGRGQSRLEVHICVEEEVLR